MTAQAIPGYAAGRSLTPRQIIRQEGKDRATQISGVLDGTNGYDGANTSYEKELRAGWLLGRNSTTGKWAPVKRTKANGLGAATATLVVDNAAPFVVGDSVRVGSNAAVAINAIVYSTNTITLASALTWADNEPVHVANGFETARGILMEYTRLRNQDNSANADKTANILIDGFFDQDKVLGDVAAVLEDYDSIMALKFINFDDYQQGIDATPQPVPLFGFKKVLTISGTVTITAADSGTLFLCTAATTATLPTKAAGLYYGFMSLADADVSILSAGSADDIVADGDAGADSVTFSTSSHKIGSVSAFMVSPDLLKWLNFNLGNTAATVA